MATLYGVNKTKTLSPTSDNIVSPGTLGGRVRVHTDSITLAAAAIGDIVYLGKTLQDGAIIVGIVVQNAALGAGVTYRIGDINDDDRYMTDIAADAPAVTRNLNIAGNQYKIGANDDDSDIVMKIAGGAATGLVKVSIFYTED